MLKIHSVKKEDRGTYYCVADNGVGKTARRNVAVDVEFKPDVKVVSTDKNNEVKQAYGWEDLQFSDVGRWIFGAIFYHDNFSSFQMPK